MSEFELDQERLAFPCDLAPVIGLSKNEIAFLKRKGCPFYGRKTTVRWVREFLALQAGAPTPLLPEHRRDSASNTPRGQAAWSGSPSASLGFR